MKLTFWFADKGYERALGPAIMAGAAVNGDEVIMRPLEEYRAPVGDGGIICGVVKREALWDHQAAGVPLLYLDKGYHRDRRQWHGASLPSWWRMCWQNVHPTDYLMAESRPADRWQRLCVPLEERKPDRDGHIVILGSSAKFHETAKLEHPTFWTRNVAAGIGLKTKRDIVYRPKPSWADATPIPGTLFDHGNKSAIADTLADAFCSVTYGSIACVDSIIAGVPCLVLGNGVARPISSNFLATVTAPYWAPRPAREQWAANLAYSHFTPLEIENGTAWKIIKEQMRHAL